MLYLVYNLVQYIVMIRLNITEFKTHLSKYLERLANGEKILLCKRNIPIAEIRPLPVKKEGRRPIGLAKKDFKVPKKFFAPLPNDLLNAFQGK